MTVQYAAQTQVAPQDRFDYWVEERLTAHQAATHDLKQLRRHSSFSDTDWKKLVYFYETAFGSAIKGL
jgi:DNA topoisomerase VI subunit A